MLSQPRSTISITDGKLTEILYYIGMLSWQMFIV